ncbi:hypothetical protein FF2_029988 [Malus domestica]
MPIIEHLQKVKRKKFRREKWVDGANSSKLQADARWGGDAPLPELEKRLVCEDEDMVSRPGARRNVMTNSELFSSSTEVDGVQPRRQQ